MIARVIPLIGFVASILTLCGCGSSAPPAPAMVQDPVMNAALESPLLVDPDLSQQNARNLAIVPPGPVSVASH